VITRIAFRVDLRVGGGATCPIVSINHPTGRSPRGRRSLVAREQAGDASGSISAWAEEPSGASPPPGAHRVDLRVGGGAG